MDTPEETVPDESGVEGEVPEAPEAPEAPGRQFVSWPPPGLEKIQGALLPAAGFLSLGVGFLILPLLNSIGSYQSFTSLGPQGGDWRLLNLGAVLGLLALIEAFRRLFRILRTSNQASNLGHGWLTVLQVAADSTRDTGFLIQGARRYANVEESVRGELLQMRVYGILFYIVGLLWALLGFGLSLFLAARGVVGPSAMWTITVGPTLTLCICALYIRVREELLRRTTGKEWRAEVEAEVRDQVNSWAEQVDGIGGTGILGRGPVTRILRTRILLTSILAIGVILLLPIITMTFTGSVVRQSLEVMIPRYQGVESKALMSEVWRDYCLEPDPSITPLEAGQALHNLNLVGRELNLASHELPPRTRYEQPWLFGRSRVRGAPSYEVLFEPGRPNLTDEHMAILKREAENPAHDEFSVLGRASAIDYRGACLVSPLPDSVSYRNAAIMIPRFQGVSDGARAQAAMAGYLYQMGQIEEAETRLREVISAGFLLIDEEPTLIGNLIGMVLTGIGGQHLIDLYRVTGREAEADRMQVRYEESQRSNRGRSITVTRQGRLDLESTLQLVTAMVTDERALRGMRWEFLIAINSVVPCINLNKAVFGLGDDYDSWLDTARTSLVRYPSEAELFELARYGWLVEPGEGEKLGISGLLLSITFGGGRARNSLATLIKARDEWR
ncbi:hypothetical protein ACFL6R_03455 [Gemmatimonadota bacterium]